MFQKLHDNLKTHGDQIVDPNVFHESHIKLYRNMGPRIFALVNHVYLESEDEVRNWLQSRSRAFFEMRDFHVYCDRFTPNKWYLDFRVYTWKNFHLT